MALPSPPIAQQGGDIDVDQLYRRIALLESRSQDPSSVAITGGTIAGIVVAPPYTWAAKPTSANLFDRIRITDAGVPGLLMVWDGTRWVPDGPQLLSRSAAAASITGTLTETTLGTVVVPASAMGLNGGLHVYATWSYTNSANTKTTRISLGGTAFSAVGATTTASFHEMRRIRNRGVANSQLGGFSSGSNTAFAASSGSLTTGAVDTSAAQSLSLTGQLTNTGETITLEGYEVWLMP